MKRETVVVPRDGDCESPWQHDLPPVRPGSNEDRAGDLFDCLVVGGGITGLTTALLLQKAGKKTAIAESHTIGFGTTGGTSAHINNFADTTYKEAESAFGKEGAQLFADAITEGFDIIKSNIRHFAIKCDYEDKTGYLYAEDDGQAKELDDIYQGAAQVGITVEYIQKAPTPVPHKKAVKFEGQAQFHPLKYLQALEKAYISAGGAIFERTRIEKITSENDIHTAESNNLNIRAHNIVYATHMPPGINLFNFECAPYRSYVMAVKLKDNAYPDALIYDMQEPYHYFRTHNIDGQDLLIAGGNDHKTGHDDPEKAFDALEKYIRKFYHVSSVKYRWSSQYYVPVDGLPYIGQMPFAAKGIYCATGFNGNGMMLGSVSGKILSDLVLGKASRYAELFSPSRIKPIDGFTEFVTENADVAYHFVADRFGAHETDSVKRLKPGTGKVIELDGKKIAAYCDEDGEIHALNPVCTHAKCIVGWNPEEKTWDCPCHGARYDIDGQVLTGPATRGLQKISTT